MHLVLLQTSGNQSYILGRDKLTKNIHEAVIDVRASAIICVGILVEGIR